MININETKILRDIYNLKQSNNAHVLYYKYKFAEIAIIKIIPPLYKSFYGFSLYPKIISELNSWSINSVNESTLNAVQKEYEEPILHEQKPYSLSPASFISEIEFFIPVNVINKIINYLNSLETQFRNKMFIEKQWSLSSPVLGINYENFMLINPNDKNINRLVELYLGLKNDKTHPLYTNEKIRSQVQISTSLFSYDLISDKTFISNADVILLAIVNLLKWPIFYKSVYDAINQFDELTIKEEKYIDDCVNLSFNDELSKFLNFMNEKYPVINTSILI